jgi:hypothetical protein
MANRRLGIASIFDEEGTVSSVSAIVDMAAPRRGRRRSPE